MSRHWAVLLIVMAALPLEAQQLGVIGDTTISQCETRTYTISLANDSGNPLTDIVVTNNISTLTGFSYVAGTSTLDINGGAAFCTANPVITGGSLTWNVDTQCGGPFTLGSAQTLNVTFGLATSCPATSGSMHVTADYEISGTPVASETSKSIFVLPGAVTIKKTPAVIAQQIGQNVTWTITVESTGLGTIENVAVTDVLGPGLAYVSSSPAGVNAGLVTTWDAAAVPGLASMDPGTIITIDVTATVLACEGLENQADVRFGCDAVTDCFNTALDGGTATATVGLIGQTPLLDFTPSDLNFNYGDEYVDVNVTVTNVGDGVARDVRLAVDLAPLTVSNVSAGATWDAGNGRFVLADPLEPAPGPGNSYDLSFRVIHGSWCGGAGEARTLLWQPVFGDDCGNSYHAPVKTSQVSVAGVPAIDVVLSGGPPIVEIGDQVVYAVISTYLGPLTCGAGSAGEVTVVDTVPDGFTVLDAGGGTWVPGGSGTGGTITWTYTPPASLATSVTLQAPLRDQCETYCMTSFSNTVSASVVDCSGCVSNDSAASSSVIQCEELATVSRVASPITIERCGEVEYTNTYNFGPAVGKFLYELVFQDLAERDQQYVPGSLTVNYDGADITGCVLLTDTTPGGSLTLDFSACPADMVNNKPLVIVYRLTITEGTVAACAGTTFFSWSSLSLGSSGSGCLADGTIHEATQVTVEPPAMSLTVAGLEEQVDTCETGTVTLTLAQTSTIATPKDVRLVLSGLSYHVVDPVATICSGAVAPTSCTPTLVGGDHVWYFGDGFTGAGQNAVIQVELRKRCTGSGDLVATAFFDDHCNDDGTYDDTCSIAATASPTVLGSGDLAIDVTPEITHPTSGLVEWTVYLTNTGTGTARFVWLDDVLGSGLDYQSAVVDDMTGVTVTADQDHDGSPINGVNVSIADMTPGERRRITVQALLVDCDNLTNDATAAFGCVGADCQTPVSDHASVTVQEPQLVSTLQITSPVDACSSPSATLTVRNVGQATAYNTQLTVSLPAGLSYVSGSTRWRVNGGAWNGPSVAYDPSPTVSPLQWTSSQIPGLAVLDPGGTLELELGLASSCPFSGGEVNLSTGYESPCGQVHSLTTSLPVASRAPVVTVTATRVDEPIDCGESLEWTITVRNTSGYTLPVIWVEATLDAAFTYTSSVGDPPFTADNGTFNGGNMTAWELVNVGHNDTVTLTLRATTDSSPCSPDLDLTVNAWWGCGSPDGSSATKPGQDPPDNTLCLTTAPASTVRTETRQPALAFMGFSVDPASLDACHESTTVTIEASNLGPTDATDVDLVITLPTGLTYNTGTAELCVGPDNTCAPVTIGDPAVVGNQLRFFDVGSTSNNLVNLLQADGGNDTLVLRFAVKSSCYVPGNLDIDLFYYDCCGDTQYTTGCFQPIAALSPSLATTLAPSSSQVACGAQQAWTVNVSNVGNGNAQVVRAEVTPGAWIAVDQGASTPGLTAMGGGVWGWEVNNLGASNVQVFTLVGTLSSAGSDCTTSLRQTNVRAIWGCGTGGDATDGNPTTTGYDCTHGTWSNAPAATLRLPNLEATSITPVITASADGSFVGSITVRVVNTGDGSAGAFTVQVSDGKGWTGVGSFAGPLGPGGFVDIAVDVGSWSPGCVACASPYLFTATVDAGGVICECDETDNVLLVPYLPPIPDLEVTDLDFSNVTCAGDTVAGAVRVLVQNAGCGAAPAVPVQLSTDGCLTFTDQTAPALAAGASAWVSFQVTGSWADCTLASCALTATADPAGAVAECDGTDNSRAETFSSTLPDLTVTDLDFSGVTCVNDACSGAVQVTVANQGFGPAANFQVALATSGCLMFESEVVATLAAGASTGVSFTVAGDWQDCTTCGCDLTATVDPGDVVCECRGDNNTRMETYTSSLPDLRVSSVTPAFSCEADGSVTGTITVNVTNTGCGAASNVAVRLTSTCGLTFTDQLVAILGAGSSVDVVFTAPGATPVNGCIFSAAADPDGLICECRGDNNTLASAPYTADVPDLRIVDDDLGVGCLADGEVQVSGYLTLGNFGTGVSFTGGVPTRFTLLDTVGCGGNAVATWTEVLQVASLSPGAATMIEVTPHSVPGLPCAEPADCRVSIRVEADYSGTICEWDGTNNTRCSDPIGVAIPDLVVQSEAIGLAPTADGKVRVTGTITLANNGTGAVAGVSIPVRFAFHDVGACAGVVLVEWEETVVVDGIAAQGGTKVVTITPHDVAAVLCSSAGDAQVSLRIEADSTDVICEIDGTNNALCTEKTAPVPDLTVALAPTADFYQAQVGATLTITASNAGTSPTNGSLVTVTATLPADLSATGIDGTGWTCTLEPLECTTGDILAHGSAYPDITLTVNVAPGAPSSLIVDAAVSGGGDCGTTNNTAAGEATVLPSLHFCSTLTGAQEVPPTGSPATGVGQVLLSPDEATLVVIVSWADLQGPATAASVHGPAAPGVVGPQLFALTGVPSTATGSVGPEAYPVTPELVSWLKYGLLYLDVSSAAVPGGEIRGQIRWCGADLVVAKSHAADFFQGQSGAAYTIVVSNQGAGATDGSAVTIADTLPAGLAATGLEGEGWSCDTGALTCTRSDLLPGESAYPDIALTVNVAPTTPPGVVNTVTVAGGGETFTGNDAAVDPTTVLQIPAITSGAATTFTVGVFGSFTVTGTGLPAPTFTVTGALPAGVGFDGASGVLSGTPVVGAGGVYPLTFTASNGVPPDATQSFVLTVLEAPAFTSPDTVTFVVGSAGSFTVTTLGYPRPTLGRTGALPGGVTFAPPSGVLAGTPAARSAGSFPLTFTAANGVGDPAAQAFTLQVVGARTSTSVVSSLNPSLHGQEVRLTARVTFTTRGIGTPGGTVQLSVDGSPFGGPLPLTGGAAYVTTAELAVGTHTVTASYGGDSSFAASQASLSGGQVVKAFGAPARLAFVQQPTATEVWATLAPAVTVQLKDVAGNDVRTAGIPVTVSLASGTGALSGVLTRSTDVTGLASFDYLVLEQAGVKRLAAASGTLPVATSNPFTVVALTEPVALLLDRHQLGPSSGNLNGVLEPGETVLLEPAWANQGSVAYFLTGAAGALLGPGDHALLDDTADYGRVPAGTDANPYDATGDTYALVVEVPAGRPATHWDLTVEESLSVGPGHTWTLHVGASFDDVPPGYGGGEAYSHIETLLHAGVTQGCTATSFCPGSAVTREQLAVFLARVLAGGDAAVPVEDGVGTPGYYRCVAGGTSLFEDVAPEDVFCRHVHYVVAAGCTAGCDATHYCPGEVASRADLAVAVARAVAGSDAGVPETYLDPVTLRAYSCDPAAPLLHFDDAPATEAFCRHVHWLWAKAVVDGCAAGLYCPGDAANRTQVAKCLVKGFGLQLYGP